MDFSQFFTKATRVAPYPYQCRLACGPDADPARSETLCHNSECRSQLINIPTGLGKTAAVVLAWLWNRAGRENGEWKRENGERSAAVSVWPRRLVYCLPMRTLVEQTQTEVHKWLQHLLNNAANLGISGQARQDLEWLHEYSPVILMGGEDAGEWDIHPERPAVLIGTQDMLLSRALNRGYGMSRYRWPMHFGLLNNDALWVMDETQLMGVGVETSAQLDGFRAREERRTHGSCPTWWMSATLEQTRLATVDAPAGGWPSVTLSESERALGKAHDLIEAKKAVSPCPVTLAPANKASYAKELAALINERHQQGPLTLVVVNRVNRAREIYEALTRGKNPPRDPKQVALIHSRFRPMDRARHTELLFGEGDRIVIATQAVEAGVDVSARLLITELAPWSSLVQRIGRCNRQAKISDAEVLWVDVQPKDEKDDLQLPYTKAELDQARAAIREITNACPRILGGIVVRETPVVRPVIRRRDLVDLFDTTPDLCGQDLDVSRYIRDGEDNDVQFFWREFEGDAPTDKAPPPQRSELCRVSIGEAAKFLGKADAWTWNPLDEKWTEAKRPRPGAVYLVSVASGGYHNDLGWTGDAKHKPTPHSPQEGTSESYAGNRLSFTRDWQTLADHSSLVVAEMKAIATALALNCEDAATLHIAAQWHDVGKAHDCFQAMLRLGPYQPEDPAGFYAKSKNPFSFRHDDRTRLGFRHELASALAWLLAGPPDAPERDLIAYLIAAHHGKVRLSIRSLPNEPVPGGEERLFARGIWHGDTLPSVTIGDITTPAVTLDLSFMKMGAGEHGPSWLARTVALRDRVGPFRLAYLETILRAADARASSVNAATTN
ncbi:MAG: CRISPR-associated endonuclease Cas3'' [Verrucomicrobia bacterium]|nr:CRISPR-associated endonuclease Cas3'' [Verrucomicrobiota bacterium]